MEQFKVGDKVIALGVFHGTIVNINDYREPAMKYAVDIDGLPDCIFLAESEIAKDETT